MTLEKQYSYLPQPPLGNDYSTALEFHVESVCTFLVMSIDSLHILSLHCLRLASSIWLSSAFSCVNVAWARPAKMHCVYSIHTVLLQYNFHKVYVIGIYTF